MTRQIRGMIPSVVTVWVGIHVLLAAPGVYTAGHVFVPERFRVGSVPCQQGPRRLGEALLNFPDDDVHLLYSFPEAVGRTQCQ